MATALDLLMSTKEDVNLLSEESDICTIDAKTRVIFVPSTIVVGGVQSDKNAERIKFSCPKIVGDNLDLSKFSVRINFENVSSVDFNVSIKDQYICDDVAVDGENVTFSWLIGRNAARYMGTVRFIVCAVKTDSDSNISVEWNTTIAEVPVLEGIEIDQPQIGQEEKDVINQLLELTKNTSAEAIQNVNSAKEQAIKDIQSVSQPDTTLTIEGGLAEAKATGEAIGSLKEDSVNKHGVGEVTKENAEFIKNDALIDIPQKKWKTTSASSYQYEKIVKDGISFKGTDVRVFIGSSTNPDRDAIAIVNLYEAGKDTYTVSRVIKEDDLNKWISITSNSSVFKKLELRLYSSFTTVLQPNTETVVNDIKVTITGKEPTYRFEGITIIEDDISKNVTVITVKPDGTGDYTNPVKATNEIFQRAWGGEKFIIKIHEGNYDIYASWEEINKTGWFVTGANVGWNITNNIKLIGVGDRDKIICNCFLPDDSDPELVIKASCINANWGASMENITFVSKNTRYCCHSDNANYYKNLNYNIKNCVFKHLGNKEGFWLYHGGWVEGSSSGNTYVFENCEFIGALRGYGTHTNNTRGGFTIPCSHKFTNCKFINKPSTDPSISFECMGSGVTNRVYINGCYIETGLKVLQVPSDAEVDIEIMMSGCSDIPIEKTSEKMKVYVM